MAKTAAGLLLILAIFFTTTILSFQTIEASGSHDLTYFFSVKNPSKGECRGSVGECVEEDDEEDEFQLDSESHRRMLYWRRRYISYGALFRNRVPCSRRGASYYNCRPGGRANPYYRGCSTITRCRG